MRAGYQLRRCRPPGGVRVATMPIKFGSQGTLNRPSRSIALLWGVPAVMEEACQYSDRPLAFLARYVRRRPVAHAAIATAVVAAVGCSVGAQYGVKVLVDTIPWREDFTSAHMPEMPGWASSSWRH